MIDVAESTRKAVKYRRGEGEIVIVVHDGRGWFDPLSEATSSRSPGISALAASRRR